MKTEEKSPEIFMEAAIKEAEKALTEGEIPVGCVIVKDGEILVSARNTVERESSPLCHAEMNALRQANLLTGKKFLSDCDLYVTVEPCAMCAGAILNARIRKLYYGVSEPKTGCCGSNYSICEDSRFNWRTEVFGEIKEEKCRRLLTEFFTVRREKC